jgi:nucleotide-binding universal stress UspA family protein
MFRKIVVGIDGLDGGEDALALARVLAGEAAEIVAVNAFPHDPRRTRASAPGYEDLIREGALEMVRRAASGMDGVRARVVGDLSPARALHDEAQREHADLIVIGSCRRGTIGAVLLGDVSRSTLHGAPCPVVIAPRHYREQPHPLRLIGVGYNHTPESEAAVRFAAGLAKEVGGELRLVSAVPAPAAFSAATYSYSTDWAEISAEQLAQAKEELDALVAATDVAASTYAVEGSAAGELEELSKHVDVLVAGSRGWGAAHRVLLGSTTDWLAHHAASPLVVVPSPVHEPIDDPTAEAVHAAKA